MCELTHLFDVLSLAGSKHEMLMYTSVSFWASAVAPLPRAPATLRIHRQHKAQYVNHERIGNTAIWGAAGV
jgi:hypothetical protein